MDQHVEVAIIVTDKDGVRKATVLHNRPSFIMRGPAFLYKYLRETRNKKAPPHFRFGVLDDEQAIAVVEAADHAAKDYEAFEAAMDAMVEKLKR